MQTPTFYYFGEADPVNGPLVYGNEKWGMTYRNAEWTDDIDYQVTYRNCPLDPEHANAVRDGTLRIILPSLKIGDFVWTWYSECCMTERVMQLFQDAGFTGFQAEPVTIRKVRRKPKNPTQEAPRLWELVVTGKGGDAHPDSGIRVFYRCEGCGLVMYSSFRNGIIVDERQWDGSDFFTVNGYPKFILVSERVKQFIVDHQLVNCGLIPAHELQWGATTRPED